MKTVKEHRIANCIRGLWGEPNHTEGPDWVPQAEMVRRTIERQTGQKIPPDVFRSQYRYHMRFASDRKGLIQDGIPGTVVIRYARTK